MSRRYLVLTSLTLVLLLLVVVTLLRLSSLSQRLDTIVKESNATRVITVTQRCALTALTASFAGDARLVIGEFAPVAVRPFAVLRAEYLVSLRGCEAQLAIVKRINGRLRLRGLTRFVPWTLVR